MSDMPVESSEPGGLPGWVMTFADLMTLLMCFFVLLLSFSEMDVAKFKQMAGSMERAFGVQAEVDAKMIPRGTSVLAQEFSPGTPQRTMMNEVRQFTVNSNQSTLDVGQRRGDAEADGEGKGEAEGDGDGTRDQPGRAGVGILRIESETEDLTTAERLAEEQAQRLRAALSREIEEGSLIIQRLGTDVVVQVLERDSFPSGSAQLEPDYLPTLRTMGELLSTMVGAVDVSGHTDNVPIATSQYRSNWDLSAMRAATVVHVLLAAGIAPERLKISGHADTQPRVRNDSPTNRALNRRIDIALVTSRSRHASWAFDAPGSEDRDTGAPATDSETLGPGAETSPATPAPATEPAATPLIETPGPQA